MPLVAPFRTSFGTQTARDVLLLRVVTDEAEGWGECVAMSDPLYSSEYVDAAADVLRRFLVPGAGRRGPARRARGGAGAGAVQGPPDGQGGAGDGACSTPSCAPQGRSFARELGAVHDRVPCGVSVGIMDSIPALLDAVGGYLDEGYVRIKLKIEPGWDVEPVRAVRERFGDDVLLQVDANTAYTLADARHLARLDPFDLLLIEQPLDEEDVLGHADLAKLIRTPVCLDESIVSAQSAAAAIRLGACAIVNIKPGRVGGYLEARRIHDVCVAHGVPVWCGGMLETGLGRAANVALAALPGLHAARRHLGVGPLLPRPTSPSRSCSTTATSTCRPGPASASVPLADALAEVTTSTEWLAALTDCRSDERRLDLVRRTK